MPSKPPTICLECQAVATVGPYCAAHANHNRAQRAARERCSTRRAEGLGKLYDSTAWRARTRRFILARDPLCLIAVLCGGRERSQDVDHIVRAETYVEQHGGDESWFFDPENLQGACHADHARKTALERRGLWPGLAGDGARAGQGDEKAIA